MRTINSYGCNELGDLASVRKHHICMLIVPYHRTLQQPLLHANTPIDRGLKHFVTMKLDPNRRQLCASALQVQYMPCTKTFGVNEIIFMHRGLYRVVTQFAIDIRLFDIMPRKETWLRKRNANGAQRNRIGQLHGLQYTCAIGQFFAKRHAMHQGDFMPCNDPFATQIKTMLLHASHYKRGYSIGH